MPTFETIGFLRKSKLLPPLDLQKKLVKSRYGKDQSVYFIVDMDDDNKSCFEKAIDTSKKEGVNLFIVPSLDTLAPYFTDVLSLLKIIGKLQRNSCNFVSLKEEIDSSRPLSVLLDRIEEAIKKNKGDLKSERQRASLISLAKSGKHIGRPALDLETIKRVKQLRKKGETLKEIAERVGVSLSSVNRVLKDQTF